MAAAQAGLRVTSLEKDSVARHASGVNAGGVRRLGRDPAEVPLSERPMRMAAVRAMRGRWVFLIAFILLELRFLVENDGLCSW